MRQSEFIDKRQYDQLGHSMRFAAEIGTPLNTSVTVQFGATACDAENVGPAFRNLIRNRFTPWLRPTRLHPFDYRPACWIYWLENVHEYDHHPHGTHVHWAVHVPPGRRAAFEKKLPDWIQGVAGMILDPEVAIDIKDIDNMRRLMGLKLYMGKGLKAGDAKKRRIRPISQGLIHGRRLSISEAINVSAINAHREAIRSAGFGKAHAEPEDHSVAWPANDDAVTDLDRVPWS